MNLKIKNLITVIALFAFSYANCGTITSPVITMSGKKFVSNGTLSGKKIYLTFDEIEFTGTIICSEECIIKSKKPFDYKQIKTEGPGKFTVIINPYDFDVCSKEELLNLAHNFFTSNILEIKNEDIEKKVEEIRQRAALSNLDEKNFFDQIHNTLDLKINYHQEEIDKLLDQERIEKELYNQQIKQQLKQQQIDKELNKERQKDGLTLGLITLIGYGITIKQFRKHIANKEDTLVKRKLLIATLLSSATALLSLKILLSPHNTKHNKDNLHIIKNIEYSKQNSQKNLECLKVIKDIITVELNKPLNLEKVEVINL